MGGARCVVGVEDVNEMNGLTCELSTLDDDKQR